MLKNEHIVRLYHWFYDDENNTFYLIQEYCKGKQLLQHLRLKGLFGEEEAVAIF